MCTAVKGPQFGTQHNPLSPKVKTQMHTLWRSKPEENTPAVLARRFGISANRVRAVVKLKEREEVRRKEGDRWNDEIETTLWGLVEDQDIQARGRSRIAQESADELPPHDDFVVTKDSFSTEEVVRVLSALSNKTAKVHAPKASDAPEEVQEVVQDAEDAEAQPNERWRFVFKDTADERTFAVRDKDGPLKKVTGSAPRKGPGPRRNAH